MPAVSEAQRRYLNARFGHAWVRRHHFDNEGKLPMHASKSGGEQLTVQMQMAAPTGGGSRRPAPAYFGNGDSVIGRALRARQRKGKRA